MRKETAKAEVFGGCQRGQRLRKIGRGRKAALAAHLIRHLQFYVFRAGCASIRHHDTFLVSVETGCAKAGLVKCFHFSFGAHRSLCVPSLCWGHAALLCIIPTCSNLNEAGIHAVKGVPFPLVYRG